MAETASPCTKEIVEEGICRLVATVRINGKDGRHDTDLIGLTIGFRLKEQKGLMSGAEDIVNKRPLTSAVLGPDTKLVRGLSGRTSSAIETK